MLVRDVMNKSVVSASPETTLREIARIMADNRIGSVVIKKNEKMVGIITEHDILKAVASSDDIDKVSVDKIMNRFVIYTTPETTVENASKMMVEKQIKKLPVISNERLIGIVTSSDIATAAPDMIKRLKKLMNR